MLKKDLEEYRSHYTGKFPHRYIAYDLTAQENYSLKERLREDGFCELHATNNLNIIYEHQIVAFYNCGGIHAKKRGFKAEKGVVSVHHINGNTFDNRPCNLIYLQDELHIEITKSQRWIYKGLKVWGKKEVSAIGDLVVIWNKQGRAVKNILGFVLRVLTVTLIKTAHNMRLEVKAKQIIKWAQKIRKNLQTNFNLPNNLPDWVGDRIPSLYKI